MNANQKRLYRCDKWSVFREQVLKKDGYCCVMCGKTIDNGILQVHHTHYIKGRKPWQYSVDMLITLCRQCHAIEHGKIPPKRGWEYVGETDTEEYGGASCEYCGSTLRYIHTVFHEDWGVMDVGCECADKLCNFSASAFERKIKTFIESNKWKHEDNRYKRHLKIGRFGYDIYIYENKSKYSDKPYFKINITYLAFYETSRIKPLQKYLVKGRRTYKTLDQAKTHIYRAISLGDVAWYLDTHPKEYPTRADSYSEAELHKRMNNFAVDSDYTDDDD